MINYFTYIMKLFYRPIDRNRPISTGTRIRQALFASTLTTKVEVVIVLTMSILFKLNVFELLNVFIKSPINLY